MKVLKFEASWCQPCKMLSKTLEESRDALADIKIETIDIDQQPERTKQYQVRGVPTIVVLDDTGNELKRKSGALNKAALVEFLTT